MNTTMAIRIHEPGGPEVLRWEEVEVPDPGPGEVLVRHEAVGLNYADIYHRSGLYPLPSMLPAGLPAVVGAEAAGAVEAVGPSPASPADGGHVFQPGDRVAYCYSRGAYCVRRVVPANRLVRLPDSVGFEHAAAATLKGVTARYLCRRTCGLRAGETVLVHAAAGATGTILSQWCKALGANVIGTAGNPEKGRLAREHGCDHVILYEDEDFVERVREITGGKGVPVVYDGVGAATFDGSLQCLSHSGMMISYGNASGVVPPFDLLRLASKCLTVARPSVMAHVERGADLEEAAAELFGHIESGRIRVTIGQRFPLAEAAEAHRALEARRTRGCTVLLP